MDTNACVYYLGRDPLRSALVETVVDRARSGVLAILLPAVVELELLVAPLRAGTAADLARVQRFTERQPGVRTDIITRRLMYAAAQIRASTRLKIPDALVVASAAIGRCELLVGNDRRFRVIDALTTVPLVTGGGLRPPRYVHLDDYLT